MIKEPTLLDRIKMSKEQLDSWPKDRRETALKEANMSANYWERSNSVEIPTKANVRGIE